MRSRRRPVLTSPLLRWALRRARRGAADTKTIVIIILAVAGGLMLLICGGAALLIVPRIQEARDQAQAAARRAQSKNNLHQIGIALHNYHDTYATFPPGGVYDEDETAYIGWQTSILPFVEQGPLFDALDMDVPWTDPANRPYYATIVDVYLHPAIVESPVNAQGLAVSHYAGNSQIFGPNSSARIASITDGTSNTVMAGEVAAGFKPWGDPDNVRDPGAGLGIGPDTFSGPRFQNGTNFVICDGSVRFVSNDISPEVLRAIATPDGNESVPNF
jgi:hypothetical protein